MNEWILFFSFFLDALMENLYSSYCFDVSFVGVCEKKKKKKKKKKNLYEYLTCVKKGTPTCL